MSFQETQKLVFLTAVSLPCFGLRSPSQWQPRLPGRHERETRATICAIAAAHEGIRSERRRTDSEDGPAVRSTQTKEAARRDAQTARTHQSRAADAAAAPADDTAAALHEQKMVANREADAALSSAREVRPPRRLQARQSRAADAAAAPADDAAARLDQNKVARREADATRRRRSRVADADATASCSNVCGVVCVCRC